MDAVEADDREERSVRSHGAVDQRFKLACTVTPLSMPPSEYFQRQCWISVEPDEHTTKAMVELVGEDRFIWASDETVARIPGSPQQTYVV